jgi:hypothetical protein
VTEPVLYRVRYRLSVAGGQAIEEVNGLYLAIDEHEQRVSEAERILRLALARHPHAMTDTQRRDAYRWLTGSAHDTPGEPK